MDVVFQCIKKMCYKCQNLNFRVQNLNCRNCSYNTLMRPVFVKIIFKITVHMKFNGAQYIPVHYNIIQISLVQCTRVQYINRFTWLIQSISHDIPLSVCVCVWVCNRSTLSNSLTERDGYFQSKRFFPKFLKEVLKNKREKKFLARYFFF